MKPRRCMLNTSIFPPWLLPRTYPTPNYCIKEERGKKLAESNVQLDQIICSCLILLNSDIDLGFSRFYIIAVIASNRNTFGFISNRLIIWIMYHYLFLSARLQTGRFIISSKCLCFSNFKQWIDLNDKVRSTEDEFVLIFDYVGTSVYTITLVPKDLETWNFQGRLMFLS